MRLLVLCTVVHAGLRGPPAAPAAPQSAAAAHVFLRSETEGDLIEDPREKFVPECQSMVHVRFEDYLPISAITKVCEDAGNHAGCHAWGDELVALFRKGAEAEDYAAWCGDFYDWFHDRFASRCTSQCDKLACKPICMYAEQAEKLDLREYELMAQEQAMAQSKQRLVELGQELDSASAEEKSQAAAAVRASDALGQAQKRRDLARRAYDAAAAKVAEKENQVETSKNALAAAKGVEAASDKSNMQMLHAVDSAKLQRKLAFKAVNRAETALAEAKKRTRASFEKLSALKEQQAKQSKTLQAKVEAVAKQEKQQGKKRQNLQGRMQAAKAELQEARQARIAAKQEVAELKKIMLKKKKPGPRKAAKQKMLKADTKRKSLLVDEQVAQRKVDDLKVALRLLKDAEEATARKKAPIPNAEERLAKLGQKIFAVEGAQQTAQTAVGDAELELSAEEEAVQAASRAVVNATTEQEKTAQTLAAAVKATARAMATKAAAEEAAAHAGRVDLAPAEGGLETTASEVSAAAGALEEATAAQAQAKEDALLAKAALEEEQRARDRMLSELEDARKTLQEERDALGAPPPGAE